jgi:hypothetical protein
MKEPCDILTRSFDLLIAFGTLLSHKTIHFLIMNSPRFRMSHHRLIHSIIEGDKLVGNAGLDVASLIAQQDGTLIAYFPLAENYK